MESIFKAAKALGFEVFISPHYFFPEDKGWKFNGPLEADEAATGEFGRKGRLTLDGFKGSGADWLERFKPYIEDGKTIVASPHRVWGPETNDLVLLLRKRRISKIILGGMLANMCVESHLRELLEQGFEVAVVKDATAGPKHPEWGYGYTAALINYAFLAHAVLTTEETVKAMQRGYDDARARQEISEFLTTLRMKVMSFSSAIEYLAFMGRDTAACVIVNAHLPDISGLELQRRLAERTNPPVIFVSDRCDIPSTVSAMKAGAIEFLTKPVDLVALIAAVRAALAQDRKLRQKKAELAKLQEGYSLLTPREREVLPLVVGGLLNKQAAALLGISEVTLQIHRGQVMRKMQAESFAELVRMAVKLRIPYWREIQPSHERLAM
jgi:FixJ family two-component response regulator/nicotinamidase-related amidase